MQQFRLCIKNGRLKFILKKQLKPKSSFLASTNHNNSRAIAPTMAAVDSGASDHYFPATYTGELPQPVIKPHPVGTANGSVMRSVSTDRFRLPGIDPEARTCKKFLEVKLPLISVGRLCKHGYLVAFDASSVYVFTANGGLITRGRRDPLRNLYFLPIPHEAQGVGQLNTKNSELANNAYKIRAVPALISYLHACAGFIPKSTWIARIKMGFYATWPGLTAERVEKYLQKSECTTMGHQKLIRQNIRPRTKKLRSKVHDVTVAIVNPNDIPEDLQNMIAMDLPGQFPITSATGYKYIFVMLDCDSNYVKGCPMKSRETDEMIRCYNECYTYYKNAGFTARLLRLDNEVQRGWYNGSLMTN